MLPTQSFPETHRDHGADTLRGIAIVMVLVLHGAVMTEGLDRFPWLIQVVDRLGSGVQLFFVLSGFVITAAMDRAVVNRDGASGFLLRRLAKLGPLYLFVLHLNIAFFWWWSHINPDPIFFRNSVTTENLNWENYWLHLIFMQGMSPEYINTLLDGGWSIVCEAYFYALMPLLIHRFSRSLHGAAWSLAVSVVVAILFTAVLGRHMGPFGYYAFPVQLPCFLMGALVYRVRQRFPFNLPPKDQAAIVTAIALLVFGFTRAETAPLGGHVMIAILFAITLLIVRVNSNTGALGLLQSIGRQSYALFLVHVSLLKIAYSTVFANGYSPGFWPSLAINLAISVGASTLLSLALFDPLDRACVRAMARYLTGRHAALQPPKYPR